MAVKLTGGRAGWRQGYKNCLVKQVSLRGMANVEPLSATEEALWRAMMRIVKIHPATSGQRPDQRRGPDGERVHDDHAPFRSSQSRIAHGGPGQRHRLVGQPNDPAGGRSPIAWPGDEDGKLLRCSGERGQAHSSGHGQTEVGMAGPPGSVRRRFLDYIDAAAVEGVAKALAEVAVHLEDTSAEARARSQGL